MTPNDTPARRYSVAAVVAAGLAGLVLGALAVLAVTGLVWTVRVQLPPPPYPPPLSSNGPGCVYPAPPGSAPTSAPALVPGPPLPPLPR
jgi:hypothetical protein